MDPSDNVLGIEKPQHVAKGIKPLPDQLNLKHFKTLQTLPILSKRWFTMKCF